MNSNPKTHSRQQRIFYIITYAISIIGALIALEIGGYLRLAAASKKELPVSVMRVMQDWVSFFHHHRGGVWLGEPKLPESLVFEIVKPGKEIILLQGDSWIEKLEIDPVSHAPNKSGDSVFFNALIPSLQLDGYVNAGVGSFAPSLAEGQLRFLKTQFGFDPQYLVFYMDQTDLGDELYRYAHLIKRQDGKITDINQDNYFQFKSQYKEVVDFHDSTFKSFGWIRYELTKAIRKISKDSDIIQLDRILSPLEQTLTPDQIRIIDTAVSGYIAEALSSAHLKKLVLVAHPHLRHLSKTSAYQNNAYDFLMRAYEQLPQDQKSRVCLRYIEPKQYYQFSTYEDVFYKEDPTSHLRPDFQKNQFPKALANALNACVSP